MDASATLFKSYAGTTTGSYHDTGNVVHTATLYTTPSDQYAIAYMDTYGCTNADISMRNGSHTELRIDFSTFGAESFGVMKPGMIFLKPGDLLEVVYTGRAVGSIGDLTFRVFAFYDKTY